MSASLAEMAAEPFTLCTGAELRARRPPAPTSGIGLVVATVAAMGEADRDQVQRKSGLTANATDLLLVAAVDTGLLDRTKHGRFYTYHLPGR